MMKIDETRNFKIRGNGSTLELDMSEDGSGTLTLTRYGTSPMDDVVETVHMGIDFNTLQRFMDKPREWLARLERSGGKD